jgi:signal peptidase I
MKRAGKRLVNIILGAVFCFVILSILMLSVFSGSVAIIRSSSMEPAMRAGDLRAG